MNDLMHHEVLRQVSRDRVARLMQEAESARLVRDLHSRRPLRKCGQALAAPRACLRACRAT